MQLTTEILDIIVEIIKIVCLMAMFLFLGLALIEFLNRYK